MKNLFKSEHDRAESDDESLKKVRLYLDAYQRQGNIDFLKFYTTIATAVLAATLIAKGCESTRQHGDTEVQTDSARVK